MTLFRKRKISSIWYRAAAIAVIYCVFLSFPGQCDAIPLFKFDAQQKDGDATPPQSEPIAIYGMWHFTAKIIDGTRVPEPDSATLVLRFEFYRSGDSRLYWYHEGENDWCERRGEFTISATHLMDRAVWINPNNSMQCHSDPDMQPGRQTRTRYALVDDELHLYFQVGSQELIMVWQRILL